MPSRPKRKSEYAVSLESPTGEVMLKVLERLGSQKRLADVCGVTQQAVSYWIMKDEGRIPFGVLDRVSAATRLSPKKLRPDFAHILSGRVPSAEDMERE